MRGWKLAVAALLSMSTIAIPQPVSAQDPACRSFGEVVGNQLQGTACVRSTSVAPDGSTSSVICEYDILPGNDTMVAYYASGGSASGFSSGYTGADGQVEITDVTVIHNGGGGSTVTFESYTATGADRQFSETGRWYRLFCSDDGQVLPAIGPLPSGDPVPISVLVTRAFANLEPPIPDSFEHTGEGSVLQLATFFWLPGIDFEGPGLSTLATHGLVEVTVTAVPTEYFLELDGQRLVECGDRNVAYVRGMSDENPAACTHTFQDAPEDGTSISVDLVLEYETSWEAQPVGLGGTLTPIAPRTNDLDHEVFEVVGLAGNG